jgi:hypothetical protein
LADLPENAIATEDTITFVVPLFVNVIAVESLPPMTTLPKLIPAGLALSPPWVPRPLSGMVTVGFDALLVIVIVPDEFPIPAGVN